MSEKGSDRRKIRNIDDSFGLRRVNSVGAVESVCELGLEKQPLLFL